jgi:hypothetical protein
MKDELIGNQTQQPTGFWGEFIEDLEAQWGEPFVHPDSEHHQGGQNSYDGRNYAKQPESRCLLQSTQII